MTRRRGDTVKEKLWIPYPVFFFPRVPVSPRLRVSASPRLRITVSPHHRVTNSRTTAS